MFLKVELAALADDMIEQLREREKSRKGKEIALFQMIIRDL